MTSIPGPAWIVIGAVVGVFSWIVQRSTNHNGMILFEIAGGIFIFIGVVKIIWASAGKKKSDKFPTPNQEFREFGIEKRERIRPGMPAQQASTAARTANQPAVHARAAGAGQQARPSSYPEQPGMFHQRVIMCPNCGTKHYHYSNFCHICGSKLKR